MTIKKEFVSISCDCGHESLIIEPQDYEDLSQGIYFAMFTFGYHKPSFWHRFKLAWYTIKTGQPYTDQMCLSLDKVKQFNKCLENYIALAEVEKKHNISKKGVK